MEVLVQHLASAHELNVTISEAISGFLAIPESLHKVTCKLCPPPHILGSQGFWLAGDVSEHMVSIEEHFEQVEIQPLKLLLSFVIFEGAPHVGEGTHHGKTGAGVPGL